MKSFGSVNQLQRFKWDPFRDRNCPTSPACMPVGLRKAIQSTNVCHNVSAPGLMFRSILIVTMFFANLKLPVQIR